MRPSDVLEVATERGARIRECAGGKVAMSAFNSIVCAESGKRITQTSGESTVATDSWK